jgi:hypothetical protein
VEDDHSDSESDDDDNGRMEKLHNDGIRSKAAEVYYGCGRKCTPEEKKDALQNAVEAMITFMEESRDVTDVAFEAEFMTSRSEYNETLDISIRFSPSSRRIAEVRPRRVLSYMASHSPLSRV